MLSLCAVNFCIADRNGIEEKAGDQWYLKSLDLVTASSEGSLE